MIKKHTGYKASDDSLYETLDAAKEHELTLLLIEEGKLIETNAAIAASCLMRKSEAVLNILTTKPESRPAARKANGAKRTGKKTPPAPALNQDGITP